jgi:maltooligosyltrehalose trehalohydrolase
VTRLGAWPRAGGVEFTVWAPARRRVDVVVTAPDAQRGSFEMERGASGYHSVFVAGLEPGARYRFALDSGLELADPASRSQPDGVHGDSQVVEPDFSWSDDQWRGLPLRNYVIYELHVGTFTDEGTFDAAIGRLDALAELGVTAIELMPVAEFPGTRNWGYDGVFPYAAQSSYGGPDGLRRLVDAAHGRGLAVVLDVVYNHLGPEGNVLSEYGPYFTDRYRTPWGEALNFDGPGSDAVRRYFVDNAVQWCDDFHIDALRLDAVHAIADPTAYPFVEQLTDAVHAWAATGTRPAFVIAESAANDARLVTAKTDGGIGCDAQWDDDFHHALHALLSGERDGYYADFGAVSDLALTYREAFAYAHRYSVFRDLHHGRSAAGLPGERFVVFDQNHDQVGNRARGDRIASLVGLDGARVAATAVLLAPFVPLLFMGEEYGETNPFPYFVSHGDPELVDAVRRGRAEEFGLDPDHAVDPQAEATFLSAKLDWDARGREPNAALLRWYRALLRLRSERPALANLDPTRCTTETFEAARALIVRRDAADDVVVMVLALHDEPHEVEITLTGGPWTVLLDTHADERAPLTGLEGDGRVVAKLPARSALVLGLNRP